MSKSVLFLGEGNIENKSIIEQLVSSLCSQNVTFFSVYCYDKVLSHILSELAFIKKERYIEFNVYYAVDKALLRQEIPNSLILEVNLADIIVLFNGTNENGVFSKVINYAKSCGKDIIYS